METNMITQYHYRGAVAGVCTFLQTTVLTLDPDLTMISTQIKLTFSHIHVYIFLDIK